MGYLAASGRVRAGEVVGCRTLGGGVSNRTVLVALPDGRAWVLKQALERLRVKEPWFSDPARIRREAEGLRWLQRMAPEGAITPLVFEDPAENLLAMQAVPQPHENYKSLLLNGRVRAKPRSISRSSLDRCWVWCIAPPLRPDRKWPGPSTTARSSSRFGWNRTINLRRGGNLLRPVFMASL